MAFVSVNIPPSLRGVNSNEVLQLVKSFRKEQKKMEENPTSSPSNHSGDTDFFTINMQPNCVTEACTNVRQKLNKLPVAQSECTIYRVHRHLRNINDKAYEPEIIAIGPYHRDKDNLKLMEEHKLHYFRLLLQRKNENVEKYVSAIGPLEQEARKCYANPTSLNATEFVEMLVLDGCFIIELARKFDRHEYNLITRMGWMTYSLQRDLVLLENQIPFFILCKLFDLIDGPNQHGELICLLKRFFWNIYPGEKVRESLDRRPDQDRESSNRSPNEIKHLLHLIRINMVSSFELDLAERVKYERKHLRFMKSANWLKNANVKFKRNEEARSLFDIKFERGTMLLPPLRIEDRTESLLRNLIAYEQYFQDTRSSYLTDCYSCVTNYVFLFDALINSSRDVEILSHFEITNNWLSDDEAVAKMINKLTDSVAIFSDDFIYGEIYDKVEEHCSKRWNRWMSNLRRNYLNTPWAIISIVAAAVLLLLTFAQTVFSGLSQ